MELILNGKTANASLPEIERRLAPMMVVMAILSSALLGLGLLDPLPPLAITAATITALFVVDRKKLFYLNNVLANILALVIVYVAYYQFTAQQGHEKLFAIANLLVYLQAIVFFQEKNPRIYWHLVMLSLLQVVVAAALNYSLLSGILMVAYLFVGLATMTLFFAYREKLRYLPAGEMLDEQAAAGKPALRRWPLKRQGLHFPGAYAGNLETEVTSRRVWPYAARIGIFTLALTVLLFLVLPRFASTPWQSTIVEPRRVVGFSQEVKLGELGTTVENPQIVMRLSLFDHDTGEPIQLVEPPLLRGSILTHYSNGQWKQPEIGSGNPQPLPEAPDPSELIRRRGRVVRQQIVLEPLNENVVFGIYPVFRGQDSQKVKFDGRSRHMTRSRADQERQLSFELLTTGLHSSGSGYAQSLFTPSPRLHRSTLRELLQMPRATDGTDPLSGLRQLSEQVVGDARAEQDPVRMAAALEVHLQRSGDFTYSLNPPSEEQGQRQQGVDHIEDFVTRSKQGHCEYFASALTLMLRSQGIPARMVVGYKVGEWNSLGEFYVVRQRNAHTWVEAYIRPAQLPSEVAGQTVSRERFPNGAWLRLDPTAGSAEEEEIAGGGIFAQAGQMLDYLEMLWITHVVGLSAQQQQELVYDPVKELWDRMMPEEEGEASARPQTVWGQLRASLSNALMWMRGNWFSWRGAAVAALVTFLVAGFAWVIRYSVQQWRLWRQKHRRYSHKRQRHEVEFFKRFESLLAGRGIVRAENQTQREFASAAGGQLAESGGVKQIASLPRSIAESFYRVRFGGQPLTAAEAVRVESALRELEAALRGNGSVGHRNGH